MLFSCLPPLITEIERVVSPARLARFGRAAGGDKNRAFRLCLWNARLCAELYLPLQIAEIAVRNAIHDALTSRYGNAWYTSHAFTSQLTQHYIDEMARTVFEEQALRGNNFTVDHVIGGLSFGFWVHLLTSRYDNLLWGQGMRAAFPAINPVVTRHIVWTSIDRLRKFRNRVFHHFAIFDQGPTSEYANLLKVVGWTSPQTVDLIKHLANPAAVINNRPNM